MLRIFGNKGKNILADSATNANNNKRKIYPHSSKKEITKMIVSDFRIIVKPWADHKTKTHRKPMKLFILLEQSTK